ncbi:MAG: hypothetical protein G8D89_20910 [gamma proteobacterium symbiont of Clathrolucina costata]
MEANGEQIYQAAYTLAWIMLLGFSSLMAIGAFKEGRSFRAIGNTLIAIFSGFAVLVRFGAIS